MVKNENINHNVQIKCPVNCTEIVKYLAKLKKILTFEINKSIIY